MMRVKHEPAARLRVLMAERDVNVNELADRSGVSCATVTALRTGRVRKPQNETAYRIARALGAKVDSIWPDI
ncbi:helix-turn-helix domain-containing protein [Alicyclobacillus fodiniaquatilis]|uniref:Helix-turn-helix domain-containing protein n=1 Tax=Alicyclobacillus fodiniaquatilis TaxID=1661150 RepID=A0ABW4JKN8_9BACL